MYDFLSGRLTERKPTYVVLDIGGVGYRVEVPLSTSRVLPREGAAKLHTYLKVSENDLKLYGFATEREREIFLRLIDGIQNLGPAKAVAILSNTSPDELSRAIEKGDVSFLKGIRGIGEKIASRLIVELRGKIPPVAGMEPGDASLTRDAVTALVSLGYDRRHAEEAVSRARKEAGADANLEELIKRSLARV